MLKLEPYQESGIMFTMKQDCECEIRPTSGFHYHFKSIAARVRSTVILRQQWNVMNIYAPVVYTTKRIRLFMMKYHKLAECVMIIKTFSKLIVM